MDYESPDLCIRSLVEYKPGYYQMELPSRYDPSPQPLFEVDQASVDNLMNHPDYPVGMCPPGWPNPPETSEAS